MNQQPWTLETRPDFSKTHLEFVMEGPAFINVCAGGRSILLGNDAVVYQFDLQNPLAGWHRVLDGREIIDAWHHHNGELTLVCRKTLLRLDPEGKPQDLLLKNDNFAYWIGDTWLISHDDCNDTLAYHDIGGKCLIRHAFSGPILALWQQEGHVFRLLTLSDKETVVLHQWYATENLTVELDRCHLPCFDSIDCMLVSGTSRIISCSHVWPLDNGYRQVQLTPYGVLVSPEGLMTPSLEAISWKPNFINQKVTDRLHNLAVLATIACFDNPIDRTRGFGILPHLITTRIDDEAIDVITSLWHRRVPLDQAAELDPAKLQSHLSDYGLAPFFLAHWRGEVPALPVLGQLLVDCDFVSPGGDHVIKAFRQRILLTHRQRFQAWFEAGIRLGLEEIERGEADLEQAVTVSDWYDVLSALADFPVPILPMLQALDTLEPSHPLCRKMENTLTLAMLVLSSDQRERLPLSLRERGKKALQILLETRSVVDLCFVLKHLDEPLLQESHLWMLLRRARRREERIRIATAILIHVHQLRRRYPHYPVSLDSPVVRLSYRLAFDVTIEPDRLLTGGLEDLSIPLPGRRIAARLKEPGAILLDADSGEADMIRCLIARRLQDLDGNDYRKDLACLKLRALARPVSTTLLLMAWLNQAATARDLERPDPDEEQLRERWLDTFQPARHEGPNILGAAGLVAQCWCRSTHLTPPMRWGLACILALTAQRLGLILSQQGSSPLPSSSESLEAWLLRDFARSQSDVLDELKTAIEHGQHLGDGEAALSRRVLERIGKAVQARNCMELSTRRRCCITRT